MGLTLRFPWLAAALLGLALACVRPVFAAEAIALDPARQPLRLQAQGDAWVDLGGTATIAQVAGDTFVPWQPLRAEAIQPLTRGNAFWVRFQLQGGRPAGAERWYLEIPYAAVDRVTLYTTDRFGGWTAQTAGDLLPVRTWPVPHRHPLMPLASAEGADRVYYLRIENSRSFSAPFLFISDSHESLGEQRTSLLLGIYFGLAALAFVLAVLAAATLRDKAFGLYAATVALMGVHQAALTGIGGLHLWPDAPRWNDVAPIVLALLGVGCLHPFIDVVVAARDRSRQLHAVLVAMGLLSLPLAAAAGWVDAMHRPWLLLPYVGLSIPLLVGVLFWAMRRGDRHAAWMLAALVPVSLGAVFPLARTAGLVPASFWTMHSMQVALAIELPILMVMLVRRSQQRRDYGRRIHGLDRFDPATGLINASVFHERLVRLIARSVRLKYRSAILLVDIVNLDQIRRDFDRGAAEEMPLRVAGRLLSAAREIDSVGRLEENRFGLLLEGPLRHDEVAEAAPRVIARCLMPFENRPIGWVPQVRVAQALIPMDGTEPDVLLARLETLLATAPPDGKRTVFMVSPISRPVPLTTS